MKNPSAKTNDADRLQNAYYAVGLAMLVVLALYFGSFVLVPLALSALFAFILSTPAAWLERRGLWRVPSVLLVTLAAFAVVATLVAIAVTEMRELAADWPQYQPNIQHKAEPLARLTARFDAIQKKMERSSAPAATQAAGDIATAGAAEGEKPAPVVVKETPHSALSWLPSLALPLVESLVHGVLIVVLTIFMLVQRESFRERLIRLAGRSRLSHTTRAVEDAAERVGHYLLLQLLINAILGLAIGTGLWLMSVPYAPLWGLLVTVLRFIPYVGFWVAGLGAIAMAAAVAPGWTTAVLTFALFFGADLVMANVIEPLVFSHGTGVSPVALLMAAVFWAFIWGPVGLLLSTPLTVCLAVLGKHVRPLGFLATILGDEVELDDGARFYNRILARDYDEASVLVDAYAQAHPRDEVYDKMILPALAEAKTDREEGDITPEEEEAVYNAVEAVLDGIDAEAKLVAEKGEVPERETAKGDSAAIAKNKVNAAAAEAGDRAAESGAGVAGPRGESAEPRDAIAKSRSDEAGSRARGNNDGIDREADASPSPAAALPPEAAVEAGVPPVQVVGCAVFGRADALALRMLGNAIVPVGGELLIATPQTIIDEVRKGAASSDKPVVVCLSTLSPGGMAQTRALLGRLRQQFPAAKLLVGRWGQTGDTSRTEKYLRASGVDDLGWTLKETIRQLVPGATTEGHATEPVSA